MTTPLPRVIAFGASISAWSFGSRGGKGFGDVLSKHFEGRAEVENEGFPGGTTESLKRDFTRILSTIRSRPNIPIPLFTIFIGANDAAEGPQHVPIEQYASNIRSFVDTILKDDTPALQTTRILLITPPPINCPDPLIKFAGRTMNEAQENIFMTNLERNARNGPYFRAWLAKLRYAEKIVEIAKDYEQRVFAVDVWKGIMRYSGNTEFETPLDIEREGRKCMGSGLPGAGEFGRDVFADGLHFGEKGNEILSEEVMKVVGDQ